MNRKTQPLWYRHIILFFCWLSYSSIYIARLNLSIANPLISEQGLMTIVQLGALGSCFFFSYAFGQIINGKIGDKISPRLMIVTGLFIAGISNALICIINTLIPFIFILWTINGFAQSMLWGPTMRLVSSEYTGQKSGKTAAMVLSTSVGIGSVAAIFLSSVLSGSGYKLLFFSSGNNFNCFSHSFIYFSAFGNKKER